MITLFHRRNLPWVIAALVVIIAAISWARFDSVARIGAGYKAKVACSEIFLAGRDASEVIEGEFNGIDPLMKFISVRVDKDRARTVAAAPLRLGRSVAIYRDGYGCTLTYKGTAATLHAAAPASPSAPLTPSSDLEKRAALKEILDDAFADPSAGHRAFVVLQNGELIAEHYADGFDRTTPVLSWSMAKSVMATMIGAAAYQGLLDIDDAAPVPEWRSDEMRAGITWRNLLHMQSGLAFDENYASPNSDVNKMLFGSADAGAVGAAQPAIHAPGEYWSYSSGTTNLLSRTLKMTLEEHGVDYHSFGRSQIFDPVGAASVVMEPDASGVFVGSSFIYATAQDWARLGQLYLQDGVWNGERLLPESWAHFAAEPSGASDRQYGGQFWLNRDGANGRRRVAPGLPEDAYYMSGHEGQFVFIIPSADMIIVRTGLTRGQSAIAVTAPVFADLYNASLQPS